MSCSTASTSLHPLVTQTLVETGKYFCPFLSRGYCRESTRCNFSHDDQSSTKIPTDYCHFFLANQCLYGQDCKFRHTEPVGDHNTFIEQNNSPNIIGYSGNLENYCDTTDHEESVSHDGSQIEDHPRDLDKWCAPNCYETSPQDEDPSVRHNCELGYDHHSNDATPTEEGSYSPAPDEGPDLPIKAKRVTTCTRRLAATTNMVTISSSSSDYHQLSQINTTTSTTKKAWQNRQATNEALGLAHKIEQPLCPYSLETGDCPFPTGHCSYLHGLVCDLCCRACLHPFDETQRRQHRDECLREHEREMELSFAVQRSRDKVCGICMDTVVEKKPITSSRFGILEKCNHIFCLDCIRKWRGTKSFDNRTIRACPECRVCSDFVVPSKYWIEDQNDKDKLIQDYKAALRSKPCRYFNEGKGECPFAGSCFYKHAYPDGRLAVMDPPKPRRKLYGASGSRTMNYVLWNILTSTDDDDWSNDELESLHYLDYASDEEEDEDDHEIIY